MRWAAGDRSNIDDERGGSGGRMVPIGIGGFLLLLVLSLATGRNFFALLGSGDVAPDRTVGTTGTVNTSPAEERQVDFVDTVANDVQDTWTRLVGGRYRRTKVVLFRDAIQSQDLAPLARRLVAQLFHGPNSRQRHECQQQKDTVDTVESVGQVIHLRTIAQQSLRQ